MSSSTGSTSTQTSSLQSTSSSSATSSAQCVLCKVYFSWKGSSGKEQAGPSRDLFNPYWLPTKRIIKKNYNFPTQGKSLLLDDDVFCDMRKIIRDFVQTWAICNYQFHYWCRFCGPSPEANILFQDPFSSAMNSQNLCKRYDYLLLLTLVLEKQFV